MTGLTFPLLKDVDPARMYLKRIDCHTLVELRAWLKTHQMRLKRGETGITLSEIAGRAQISRQTMYALMRDQRGEFGEVAQIRLSRVIAQISADPAYQQTRLMRLSLSPDGPRLHIGTR